MRVRRRLLVQAARAKPLPVGPPAMAREPGDSRMEGIAGLTPRLQPPVQIRDHGRWKGDMSSGMRNPRRGRKGFLHWGTGSAFPPPSGGSEPSPHIGPAEAPSPLRTSAKHVQTIARNALGMREEGSFAARRRDEIPPDRVLPHPITFPRERAAPRSSPPPRRKHPS
jgi:hypothetical protein